MIRDRLFMKIFSDFKS